MGTATTQMLCQASQDPFFFRGDLFEGPVGVYHFVTVVSPPTSSTGLIHSCILAKPEEEKPRVSAWRFFISLTLMFDVDFWCQSLAYGLVDHHQKQQETYPWDMKRKHVSTELYKRKTLSLPTVLLQPDGTTQQIQNQGPCLKLLHVQSVPKHAGTMGNGKCP